MCSQLIHATSTASDDASCAADRSKSRNAADAVVSSDDGTPSEHELCDDDVRCNDAGLLGRDEDRPRDAPLSFARRASNWTDPS